MNTPSTPENPFMDQTITDDYERLIHLYVNRYDDMLWASFYYLPASFTPTHVLDLGCGTGNVSQKVLEHFPKTRITAVDGSPLMLEQAQAKFPERPIEFVHTTFETLELPANQFDLVISNLAIHHIDAEEKQTLFHNIYDWLKPGGFFILSDQVVSTTQRLTDCDVALAATLAKERGATSEEVDYMVHHVTQVDQPSTVQEHLTWFAQSGFIHPEVVWRYGFWAVFQCQKPA